MENKSKKQDALEVNGAEEAKKIINAQRESNLARAREMFQKALESIESETGCVVIPQITVTPNGNIAQYQFVSKE